MSSMVCVLSRSRPSASLPASVSQGCTPQECSDRRPFARSTTLCTCTRRGTLLPCRERAALCDGGYRLCSSRTECWMRRSIHSRLRSTGCSRGAWQVQRGRLLSSPMMKRTGWASHTVEAKYVDLATEWRCLRIFPTCRNGRSRRSSSPGCIRESDRSGLSSLRVSFGESTPRVGSCWLDLMRASWLQCIGGMLNSDTRQRSSARLIAIECHIS